MTVIATSSIEITAPSFPSLAVRGAGYAVRWKCTTEAELPSASVIDGDTAFTDDTGALWVRTGGVWLRSGVAVVSVAKPSDFPAPVAGVITLRNDVNYVISGQVDISPNRIVCGTRIGISGQNRINDRIVSDTAGVLFTMASNVSVVFKEVGLRCPNGTLLGATSTGVAFLDCTLGPCANGGNVVLSGAFPFTVRNTGLVNSFTVNGFTFTGTSTSAMRVFDNLVANNAGVTFDLGTSVFNAIDVGRNVTTVNAGQTFLSGTTGGANVTSVGQISHNLFSGAGTPVTGLTRKDPKWSWTENEGVQNTPAQAMPVGTVYLSKSAANPSIALDYGTWTLINTSMMIAPPTAIYVWERTA